MDKVGAISNFPKNTMTEVNIRGKAILVVHVGDDFYLTAARCPHMHGDLGRGSLNGTVITCPLHGSQFDARTGEVIRWTMLRGEDLKEEEEVHPPKNLMIYPCEVQEGVLYAKGIDE